MCVRRCRSKLFDRGEVYWQPGKVHTCLDKSLLPRVIKQMLLSSM